MNALAAWLIVKFVLRFWRPLLVSIGALVSAALAFRTNPTLNVSIFVGAFLASEAVFTVQRLHRRKLGLLSTPQRIGYWYQQRVSAGVTEDALDMRRASAPLFALSAFGVALDGIFVGLLLEPTRFGEKTPFFLEGRIILALFAGGLLALCLVLLALAIATFSSASFARRWARLSHEPIGPFSSETNVLPLAAALVTLRNPRGGPLSTTRRASRTKALRRHGRSAATSSRSFGSGSGATQTGRFHRSAQRVSVRCSWTARHTASRLSMRLSVFTIPSPT